MPKKSRSVASKACDLCRKRKIRCTFNIDSSPDICAECIIVDAPCTFLSIRKPRGPLNRCVVEAKRRAATAILDRHSTVPSHPPPQLRNSTVGASSLLLEPVTISHLIPRHLLKDVVNEFFERVYPALPLVHRPTFSVAIDSNLYDVDPSFLRQVLAIIAVTISSTPSMFAIYRTPRCQNVAELVSRASDLITLSRMSTEPIRQHQLASQAMITTVLLAIAAHSAGLHHVSWNILNEAILLFRGLELYKADSYRRLNLDAIEVEMCKRAFWVIYMSTLLDRMAFSAPHVGLAFDPLCTEWDFLLPLELSDQELCFQPRRVKARKRPGPPPTICGFIALIKVFLCVVDIIGQVFPSSPHLCNHPLMVPTPWLIGITADRPADTPFPFIPKLESLLRAMRRFSNLLKTLPEELTIVPHKSRNTNTRLHGASEPLSVPFDIMRANIHITSIYLQWSILEMCIATLMVRQRDCSAYATNRISTAWNKPWDEGIPGQEIHALEELHQLRTSLIQELVKVVQSCSAIVLESCGLTTISMIRQIGSTLSLINAEPCAQRESGENDVEYISNFFEIIHELEYAPEFHGLNGWRLLVPHGRSPGHNQ